MIKKSDKKYLNNPDYSMPLEKFFEKKIYAASNKDNTTVEKVYLTSNEWLGDSFKQYGDLTNKRVLTVGSSGDQLLNSILMGSTDVTLIDANLFAKYFVEYKIAIIKNFDYENYIHLIMNALGNYSMFNFDSYKKIFHDLSDETAQFWGTIFMETNFQDYLGKTLIHHAWPHKNDGFTESSEVYEKLKKNLKTAKISFKTAELNEFSRHIKGKFDLILLSNIYDYYNCEFLGKLKFKHIAKSLYKNNLADGGILQVEYEFPISDNSELLKTFKDENIQKLLVCPEMAHYNYILKKPLFDKQLEK